MTPLAASATIVNLLLATGPFSYPQGFVELGPVVSTILLAISCIIAYITATFMIEAISVANAEDPTRRRNSLFTEKDYKSLVHARKANVKDQPYKESPFYIRQKIEIGVIADTIANNKVKNGIMIVLIIYMYGAICFKYVSGAESFVLGVSWTFWKDEKGLEKAVGFDPYYLGIATFGFFSLFFSFGNIENAKVLQIVTTLLRFTVTILMCIGALYYIEEDGAHIAPVFEWSKQIKALAKVFGNTTFAFIYHHSISGIISPVRPQAETKNMFLYSNIVGSLFLLCEAMLAWIAFSDLKNDC